MADSEIRRKIEQRGKRNLAIKRIKQQVKEELQEEFDKKQNRRSRAELDRFIMPRSLFVLLVVALCIYALVFAIFALEFDRRDFVPFALLIPVAGIPIVFVGIYIQFFLTWLSYRFFWLFATFTWLIIATVGLLLAVRMLGDNPPFTF